MSMSSKPIPGSPLANLSLSDPRCMNDSCQAFYDAHQLSQKLVSYSYQFEYGHFTTWYYLAFIGLFATVHLSRKWQDYRYRSGTSQVPKNAYTLRNKSIALWRYVAYKRFRIGERAGFNFPSTGMLLFLLLAILYTSTLTFAVRPYYRDHRGYGSPPIAVRTGLMAIALTPLIIALSGKANLIAMLTGISHEKLNIIHRWVSYICLGLSVVHTIPFIIAPLRDGGYAALSKQFYKPGGLEYTGVPPLAMLFGLVVFSLPWIRQRLYEGFYNLHVLLAVSYVGLMFWHAADLGDSWVYLWATLAAWLISLLVRIFWRTRPMNVMQKKWMVGCMGQIEVLTGNMVRLDLSAPEDFHWCPGQHAFLRIPEISAFDNHPFTIASAESCSRDEQTDKYSSSLLRFYLQTRTGFTSRLMNHLKSNVDPNLSVWIDGPYGGIGYNLEYRFDTVLLVAGGSGISACLPWLEHFAHNFHQSQVMRTTTVKLIWSIRDEKSLNWISDVIENLDLDTLNPQTEIIIHVTGKHTSRVDNPVQIHNAIAEEAETCSFPKEDGCSHFDLRQRATIRYGRLVMPTIFQNLKPSSKTVVIGCGPESFKTDLSNACAQAQSTVILGKLEEIALRTETFGW